MLVNIMVMMMMMMMLTIQAKWCERIENPMGGTSATMRTNLCS